MISGQSQACKMINKIMDVKEQEKLMLDANVFYEQFKLDVNKKYISSYENDGTYQEGDDILYKNKRQICLVIYNLLGNSYSPSVFLTSLKEYKPIIRDGEVHNPLCEYAVGNSCNCPCNEKYHGLRGK